ncbi:MAG: GGDEF domain-containing protein, partial [Oscillospiraceae bacterium]|nr:GGDEF domain-containing protein [Oscillospiraceae bacterium]
EDSAGVMNLSDMWGSFNTGAVPIFKDGEVIGIVSTDIADTYIQHSNEASRSNAIFQVSALFATMAIMTFVVAMLMRSDRRMQARLFRMANYDVLTGLPNRQYLMSYLPEISEKAIKKNAPFALFLIDLDNFKQVNDNSGHDAGDVLLKSISDYLNGIHADSKSFRPPAGILSMSARIGGDEFVQVVANVRTEDDARAAAEKVLGSFSSETVDRYVDKYKVGLSIGVAMFPHHTSDYRMLIKYADLAMYHAKNSGKHTYRIYSEEMDQTEKKGAHANERRRNRA